ncbi:MAG: MraY family glycosyltransferase [Eggerthellales bacterium]|nr:MraY family glycosyltransferase [Eggerthellales bacterium]
MGITLRHFLVLGLVAFLVAYICVPLVRKLAIRLDAVDYPSARRVNTVPTPRMGGVAICAGIFAAIIFEVIGEVFLGWAGFYVHSHQGRVNHLGVMIGIFVIALTGAIDDVKSLRPKYKLLGQILGACIIVASGILLSAVRAPVGDGFILFGWFAYPLTVFYLVAFMNVINLIDGLDGLAAGIVAISSGFLFAIAFGKGLEETAMLSIILLGACLAFLRYNFNPASIFMGDSGSLTLGAMVAVISLLGVMRSPTFILMVVPLIIAAIPIMDTAAAIIRRLYHHQPIQQADKKHLHHHLLAEGFSVRRAVLIVYGWTTLLGIGAYIMSTTHGIIVGVVFAALVLISIFILGKLHIFEPVLRHYYHRHHHHERALVTHPINSESNVKNNEKESNDESGE